MNNNLMNNKSFNLFNKEVPNNLITILLRHNFPINCSMPNLFC